MTAKQKHYQENRLKIIKRTNDNHLKNLQYPVYVKLIRMRHKIYNVRESIIRYTGKIRKLERKLDYCIKRKGELESKWRSCHK